MKLIGSLQENAFRRELINSHTSLFSSDVKQKVRETLFVFFPELLTAYILDWIPEQGEDIYTFLIDDKLIAVIEVNKFESNISLVKKISISKYQEKLKKINQIKLMVALDLAKLDIINNQK